MKKLSLLLLVLLAGGVCFAQQLPINCATNTPCTQNGPINTKTGDPLWQVGYKLNFNFNQIFGAFGATGLLRGNGPLPNPLTPATYADVAALFTGCSSTTPALGYQGTCVSGGGSGGMVYPGAGIPDSTGTAWGTSYATVGTGSVVLQGVDTATAGNTLTPDCAYSMDKVTATTYLIPAPTQSAPTTASTGGSLAGNTYYYVVTAETSVGQTTVSVQQAINSDADVPPTNGTLTATSGGTLAATTYYVESTWVTASGQTTGATETSLAVAADNVLNVAAPASPPSNATGWNVYVSTGSGNEELQNSSPLGTTTAWVEPTTGLVTGAIVPTLNTAYLTNTNENIINWTAVTGATGYIVYRSTTANDFTNATSYTTSGGGGSALTFTDTGASGTTATPPTSNTTGQFTINAPASCTPTDGQKLEVKIISPAGGLITYAWPSTIIGSTQLALPLTSAGAGLEDYFQLQYDADLTDWVMLSYNQGF
jgi:hypothetical protein